ncbi:cation-translocating P-type ATPase [Desulfatiglans anilini]|uniref:cation-translocating P-type ATPase n=1 Tax=Desulfatiglans anilini TaxID=90728 RepID=UPI00040DE713|nr:HAD-IC family P-type ATPase [Desulfatiglans anilini]
MQEERNRALWHAMEIEDVLGRLEASKEGMTSEEARLRLEEAGPNSLEVEEETGPLRLLFRQVQNPLIYLLAGAAVLSLLVDHQVDAAVIAGVIVLNTLLGFMQEWRAEGALAALRKMASPHAKVLRDGGTEDIDAAEVVPGDILILETGDRVAAGARVLLSEDLHVDESALTGESVPVPKSPDALDEDASMADQKNMLRMSTSVTGGRGRAIVVATGMKTEIGRIAAEVRATSREDTPLQKRMHKLGMVLGLAGLALAAGVFGLGILRGHEWIEMLMFSVAVAVSAIPEGLPAVISVTLALGVRRMAGRKAIIRRMPAVETLGSTTVICSDKTGTITKNQMTVQKIWAGGRTFEVSGEGYAPEGRIKAEDDEPIKELPGPLKRLLEIGLFCNNAELQETDGRWTVEGNPSEGALVVAAIKAGMDKRAEDLQRLAEIPFSSDAKYMATLHRQPDGGKPVAFVKGAPERILEFCSHVLKNGEAVELDARLRTEIVEISERLGSEALRVMAGAFKEIPQREKTLKRPEIEKGLTLAGLWGMMDPPREESIRAVEDAKGAGIKPVMITGDHALTALAVAKAVGIAGDGKAVTGSEIDALENPALAEAALQNGVFARVTPAHKLKIMEALKGRGHIVAMTGDGVNDAPALKGADIGVAMGITGTEVAKEAADMILMDDNFATIVRAVEEGRVIYNNLRRVVFFLLATNLGEILTLVAALILGLDLPLTAVMVLWVNLVTDGACTVPLGMEPGHADILERPPRDPDEFIIDRIVALRMALLTPIMAMGTIGLFWYAGRSGNLEHARTVAFTTLAAFQWFQAFNARAAFRSIFSVGVLSNRWVLLGVGTAVILQIGAVHSPIGQMLFGTTSLALSDWLLILSVSSSIWVADEIFKLLGLYGNPERRRD